MNHWLAEGRTLGASLRRFNCIVVAGPDSAATADVALGIATIQAEQRRVVLGDLLGDADGFAKLRIDDDHHGLADAFHFGISLGRVARPVPDSPGLHFAPTGSDVVDYAELLAHPRWPRLIASFIELDELFVVAVPLGIPGIDDLVMHTDGIVLVDGQAPARINSERVIAQIRPAPPAPIAAAPKPAPRPSTVKAVQPPPATAPTNVAKPPAAGLPPSTPANLTPVATRRIPGLGRPVVVGALITLVASLFIYWLADRFAERRPAPVVAIPALSAAPVRGAPSVPIDPNALDPADSGGDAYAVQLMAANTQSAAILKLQEHGASLPAATYAPVAIQGRTWFKVLAGAYKTRGGADSLLTSLRANQRLKSADGVVVRVPYALRIDVIKDSPTVDDYLASIQIGRNVPAYTLYQGDGNVWIMVGAFETRSQADPYAQTLRSIGFEPQLMLRHGRTY